MALCITRIPRRPEGMKRERERERERVGFIHFRKNKDVLGLVEQSHINVEGSIKDRTDYLEYEIPTEADVFTQCTFISASHSVSFKSRRIRTWQRISWRATDHCGETR
jgi:hypothetical protein